METEFILLLDLDERNLAHFLSALALVALAGRVQGDDPASRCCWWCKPDRFAIRTRCPADNFRPLLFEKAHAFLKAMEWHPGLGGVAHGIITSGDEMGVNPFVPLDGDEDERPLLRTFSGKVIPNDVLPQQKAELKPPSAYDNLTPPPKSPAWLGQRVAGAERNVTAGVSSWGYDYRVNVHASDAGISSDAEGSGCSDPIYPAIELLSLAGAAFFAPAHAWTAERNKLRVQAWTQPLPLRLAALASSGRVHGLPRHSLSFTSRPRAHGKGASFRYFPPATVHSSAP